MSEKTKTVKINGKSYTIGKFYGRQANKLFLRVAKIIAPYLKTLLASAKHLQNGLKTEINDQIINEVGSVLSEASLNFDVDYVADTIEQLLEVVQSESGFLNDSGRIDLHFQGCVVDMYILAGHVIHFNGFLGQLGALKGVKDKLTKIKK